MKKNLLITCVMLLFAVVSMAQNKITVSGVVSDKTGMTVIGATVSVKGAPQQGVVTGLDGDYKITNVPSNAVLLYSYIGMKDQEIAVNGRTTINVVMQEDNMLIDEVVVVGYGVQRKSDLTGAVGSIKSDDLKKISTPNVANALQGRVSGVFISASGAPGSSPEVRIRGIGTTNNSNPLYVVDGMFMDDISFLSNHDIESMEVLKDASATAMYGSRGANGVIIVTTKQGAEGKAQVNITASEGFQFQNSGKFEMCTASEYAMLQNEANLNINPDGGLVYDDPASFGKGTNWFDEIFRVASVRDYQVAVSGGTEKVRYNLSAGYFQQDGIIKENSYDRFTLRANNSYKINKHLTIGHNLSASFSHTKNENKGVVKSAYKLSPIITPYDENGNFSDPQVASTANPLATLHYMNSDNWKDRIVGSAFLNWEVIKGLNFKTSLGIDYINGRSRNFTPKYYISEYQKVDENSLSKTWTRDFTWLWENILTYDWQINDKNRLNLLGGITAQKYTNEKLGGSGRNFFSEVEDYWYLDQSSSDTRGLENNGKHEAMMSYLFRANYALMDRYLLTASIRADGSSKFGPDNRWGYFPSVAAGWRISEEAFIKDNVEWLSNLKIRGSWGQIGNDKIGNDKYYALANVAPTYDAVFGGDYYSGGTVTSLYNTQIHWERSEQLDLGFDLGLFKTRIILGIDYFNKITDNLITSKVLPNTSGYGSILTNLGKVRFRGFDAEITTRNIVKKDFTWESKFTITYVKNKVLKLPENGRDKNRQGGYSVKMQDGTTKEFGGVAEGEPLGRFYGYKKDFIITTPEQAANARYDTSSKGWDWTTKQKLGVGKKTIGDYEWKDLNGDDIINSNDMFLLGNTIPHTTGGLNNTFTYKGFTLNVYLDFALGHSISNGYLQRQMCNFMNGNTSLPAEILKCWNVGDDPSKAKYARFSGNDSDELNKNFRDNSDVFTQKADYLCIREISLQYALPQALLAKIGLKGLVLTLAGNNLHYFTEVIGLSPEVGASSTYSGSFNTYPPIRKFSIGCKVTL